MLIRSIAIVSTLALASCAYSQTEDATTQSASAAGRDCFFLSEVSGFNDAPDIERGSDRIYVHTGPSETYLFETFGSCPDLNYSETIAFDQNGPGRICRGIDVDLLVPTSIGVQRCPVRMISRVPEDE
ncbi:DUF6491 family protein [Hyphomonas atlantica]|uniref:DUF6491 family protein n=1 Tax=Hyphomonas atlantica TaxID=1280948 RepID=UPI0035195C7E